MLVKQPTHLWVGLATRALDHFYTRNPEKASYAEVLWTGMSDHALIRVKRYTKKLTIVPRQRELSRVLINISIRNWYQRCPS